MGTYGVPPPIGPPDQQQAMRDRLRMLGIGGGVGMQNPQQQPMQPSAPRPLPPPRPLPTIVAPSYTPDDPQQYQYQPPAGGSSSQYPNPSSPPVQGRFAGPAQDGLLDRGSIPGGPTGELGPAMARYREMNGAGGYGGSSAPSGAPPMMRGEPAPVGPSFAAQAAQRMGTLRPMGPSMGPPPMRPMAPQGMERGMGGGYGMGMGGGRMNNGGMGMRPPMRPQPMPRPGGGMGYGGGDGMGREQGQGQGQITSMPRRPTPPTNSSAF